jgi:hypothetical protein
VTVKQRAKNSSTLEAAGRAGLTVRGVLHITVGLLALRVAFGRLGEQADTQGAMRAIARQPMGRVLVAALALGFAGYAVWRFVEAFVDPEDKSGWKRLGYIGRGVLYVGFCVTAARLVVGGQSTGGGDGAKTTTARALELPGGRFLVAAVGLALLGAAGWNGWRAVTRGFEKELKHYEMSPRMCRFGTVVGTLGHGARMLAYLLVGGFLLRAAVRHDPSRGVGLDAALKELVAATGGPPLLGAIALGLLAFGGFQLLLARYRRVLESS